MSRNFLHALTRTRFKEQVLYLYRSIGNRTMILKLSTQSPSLHMTPSGTHFSRLRPKAPTPVFEIRHVWKMNPRPPGGHASLLATELPRGLENTS